MKIPCDLCPLDCRLSPGEVGKCRVRGNVDGQVKLLTYGLVTTALAGPIEQKPIYHFHPGSSLLSIGGSGCNMFCGYCQNFEISQTGKAASKDFSAEGVVRMAKEHGCSGIAFTYSEPLVWFEYVMDVAKAARLAGLKTILKTNGFLNPGPFAEMMCHIDAMNMDIKGTASLYKQVCDIDVSEDPSKWVMIKNLKQAKDMGVFCEISHIAIPPFCDDVNGLDSVLSAVISAAGADTPIHVLKFIPDFKMRDVPPTTDEQLDAVFVRAKAKFRYVYVDYAGRDATTECDSCGIQLVKRRGILLQSNLLTSDAKCFKCGKQHGFVL